MILNTMIFFVPLVKGMKHDGPRIDILNITTVDCIEAEIGLRSFSVKRVSSLLGIQVILGNYKMFDIKSKDENTEVGNYTMRCLEPEQSSEKSLNTTHYNVHQYNDGSTNYTRMMLYGLGFRNDNDKDSILRYPGIRFATYSKNDVLSWNKVYPDHPMDLPEESTSNAILNFSSSLFWFLLVNLL
jgi:hypothetical protein